MVGPTMRAVTFEHFIFGDADPEFRSKLVLYHQYEPFECRVRQNFDSNHEHGELDLMAEAGLSPMQILGSATNEAARCLQVDDKIGTLESGKWADFVVLGANPLENIHNTRSIESVWIGGRKIQD